MTQGSRPLPFIARDAGFSSQAHLTSSFKAITGFTPGLWRSLF